jgi:branched-chain amino acid aminotransferase
MYSSVFGGIVTDPRLMLVPADDHVVHRGDGVFETIKFLNHRVYLLREHIVRLFSSAARIGLKSPWSPDDLVEITQETVRAGGHETGLIRILLSRGPGSLGVNPYDCPRPGLYVLAHKLGPSFMDAHPAGARVRASAVPVKSGFFANVKSCNYLPNAMMKKEAVDAGVDFTVAYDERGFLAEGATENLGLVMSDGVLLAPRADRILTGTTMLRVLELAAPHMKTGHADLRREDVLNAAEILIFGTTPDVTAVVEYDGRPVGGGVPGPVYRRLADLLRRDIAIGEGHHTVVR